MIAFLAILSTQTGSWPDLFDVTKSEFSIFKMHDLGGRTMDCLKIVSSSNGSKLYGVYHALNGDAFELWLAESADAKRWRPIRKLDDHAHQGTIAISKQGKVLVAWEKDVPGKGNHIHIAYFPSEKRLEKGTASKSKDIDRSFSPSAEGTPSFESIVWSTRLPKVVMGFHYWRNSDVDRQAVGRLDEKWTWACVKRPEYDTAIEGFGVTGNIGDRDSFELGGNPYTLVEGMMTKGDWSTWSLYLIDEKTRSCTPIRVKTYKGSLSFANPNVTIVKNRAYVTLFMPSQGNDPTESGELVYAVKLPR